MQVRIWNCSRRCLHSNVIKTFTRLLYSEKSMMHRIGMDIYIEYTGLTDLLAFLYITYNKNLNLNLASIIDYYYYYSANFRFWYNIIIIGLQNAHYIISDHTSVHSYISVVTIGKTAKMGSIFFLLQCSNFMKQHCHTAVVFVYEFTW